MLIKNRSQKTIIILFSIISLIFLSTVVYSVFSSTMTITGTAASANKMWIVDIEGRFGENTDRGEYATIGVRPVLSFPIYFFNSF